MSLSSRKTYTAVLGAYSVGLYLQRHASSELLGRADFNADQYPAWPAAADALARLLEQHAQGRSELRVLLSNHFTRVLLVPWLEQVTSPEELASYARLCFEDIYAESATGWAMRLSPESAGRARLAAAIPEGLLGRLQADAQASGCCLVSVQPYLMAAFNRFSQALAREEFLFIVAEPGRSSLLLAREGGWESVRSVSLSDSATALNALIARENQLQQLEDRTPAPVYLHAPGRTEQVVGDTLAVQRLDALLPQGQGGDPLHAMSQVVN